MVRKTVDDIKTALRKRIVLHFGGDDLVLHEGRIAEEFGLSRTPIRQVIQGLASEWLVEVRSGVGSVAMPVLPERRTQDIESLGAVLDACAKCSSLNEQVSLPYELGSIQDRLSTATPDTHRDVFFDANVKMIDTMAGLVSDEILRSALIASYWRFIRRRFADHEADLSLASAEIAHIAKDAAYGATEGGSTRALRMAAGSVDQIGRG